MNEEKTEATADHESDPAHTDETGQDWSDEGGASTAGPATHVEPGHVPQDGE